MCWVQRYINALCIGAEVCMVQGFVEYRGEGAGFVWWRVVCMV